MDIAKPADFGNADHAASIESNHGYDRMSVEECERLVLSPPAVPMDLETACAAICAAARRSNSSRTHSIKTQPHDGHSDTQSNPSELDLCRSKPGYPRDTRDPHRSSSTSRWRRLLCCFPDRSATVSREKNHIQYGAPCVRKNAHVIVDHEDGDTTLISMTPELDKPMRKSHNRKLKLFPFKITSKRRPNNVTNLSPSSDEPPVLPDRSPQRSIPPSHGFSDSKADSISSPASTTQHYHPTLPNFVLNSLIRTDRPASYPIVSSPVNGHGVSEADQRNTPPSFQTAHQSSAKMHTFTITLPKLPGFRRSTPDSVALSSDQNQRDMTVSLTPSTCNSSTLYTTSLTVSPAHDENTVIQPRLLPHGAPWDGGDVDVSVSSDMDQTDYHAMHDQNGGQGDSSSENLDTMTPGIDLLGEIPEDCADKKCLVLDLDETLVHSWFKYVENANFVVPVDLDGVKHQIYVCKRPHLDEFLRAVGPLFECVMFTASLRKYADPVCDFIDNYSCFRHRLFREACVYHQNNLIKDLSRLGRDVNQICIVDNSPVSFLFQPDNALQINSWFDDPNDQALLDLVPYLTALAKSETVVDYLREFRPPSSAAVAQPATPSWLLLFNSGLTDDQDGSEAGMDDVSYDYTEADAVLSPHFHPPNVNTSTSLLRSYLAQVDRDHAHSQPSGTQLVVHQHRIQLTPNVINSAGMLAPSLQTATPASGFVHQVTRPETTSVNSIEAHLPSPTELQDTKT